MSEADASNEAVFAQMEHLLDEVASGCVSLDFGGAGVESCVELIGKLKSVSVAMDGLKVALMGHVRDVQAAQARARAAREEEAGARDRGADEAGSARPEEPPGLLSGRDATMFDVMARTGMQSRRAAGNEVRAAQVANESFPGFVKLMRQGRISQDYVEILRGAASRPELVERSRVDEELLIGWALEQDVDEFRKSMRAWTFQHAPKMAERKAVAAERREKFRVYADGEGYKVYGWLTAMSGAALNSVIRAHAGVPAKADRRHQDERNAEALMQIVHGSAGAGGVAGGVGTGAGAGSGGSGSAGFGDGEGTGSGSQGASMGNQRAGGLRHQVLVHVPLSTLVRTEEAIEKGCRAIAHGFGAGGSKSVDSAQVGSGLAGSGHAGAGSGSGSGSGSAAAGWVPPMPSRFGPDPAGDLDCPVTGRGLGRQGACTESRADIERDLGTVLGMIRAGIDVSMLDGFAPARLSDGSPLAPSQLAQLMCDSDLARVVLTAHGEPIDVSRNQRTFSARQTKAVLARDRHCRFPGCSRGLEVGQVHHAQEWEKGGATVVDNAVLLCFAHHRYVHQRQVTISHHAGGFVFTEPDGTLVGLTHHARLLAA